MKTLGIDINGNTAVFCAIDENEGINDITGKMTKLELKDDESSLEVHEFVDVIHSFLNDHQFDKIAIIKRAKSLKAKFPVSLIKDDQVDEPIKDRQRKKLSKISGDFEKWEYIEECFSRKIVYGSLLDNNSLPIYIDNSLKRIINTADFRRRLSGVSANWRTPYAALGGNSPSGER